MGKEDISEKTLISYNDVFSDIINVLLFNGEERIFENDLEDAQAFSQYKADNDKLHEQERDVSKYWKNTDIRTACLGVENQTDPDSDMPLRVMGYDGASYRSQMLLDTDQNGKLIKSIPRYPVITIVLYFGTKPWNKRSLSDCLNVPDVLGDYFNDYRINLFEIARLPMETVNKFKSDFRIVAEFFVKTGDKNSDYVPTMQTIKHVDAVLKFLRVMTNDSKIDEILAMPINSMERRTQMESYFTVLYNRGEAKGKDELLVSQICKKLRRFMNISQIAQEVEEDEIRVKLICDIAERFAPDYDEKQVFEAVRKELVEV